MENIGYTGNKRKEGNEFVVNVLVL